jgi:hypothetical protein
MFTDGHEPRGTIKRPGISSDVLISAGIRYSDTDRVGR